MSQLTGLFKKASAATQSASPAPTPAAPPKAVGFKIGGGHVTQPAVTQEEKPSPPSAPNPEASLPAFSDQTPATLPQRELPAEVEEGVSRFVANLDHLHSLIPEPDLASEAIKGIMIELKKNPAYSKHVMPDDVRVIVQMMRETMGLAKITKEAKVSKRRASNTRVTEALAELDELMGGLD